MNPFEITKDPDGGGITVRSKNNFVVPTREEERRATKCITEILAENEKLRELVRDMFGVIDDSEFDPIVERQGKRGPYYEEDMSWRVGIRDRMRELRIEVRHV